MLQFENVIKYWRKNMKKLNSEIYKIDEIYNFRDLVTHSANKYQDNVAYKFKRRSTKT